MLGQIGHSKEDLIQSIEKISKVIDTSNKEISATTKNYRLLESKIEKRKTLIGNIGEQKIQMDSEIDSLNIKVNAINAKLGDLRKQYSKLLKLNYVQSMSEQRWSYILSSKTLLEGYKRWIFSKQYKDFLGKQRDELYKNLNSLEETMGTLNRGIADKESLLQTANMHSKQIEKENEDKEKLLSNLKKNADQVKMDLDKQKKEKKKRRKEIESLINAQSENTTINDSGTGEFKPNLTKAKKGSLIWPIENALVTSHYGKHPHPSLKNVEVLNNGIDMNGAGNNTVKLVFDGEVIGRKKLSDKGIMIIVKHGNYYTVYSKIVVANVRAGDKLKQGTVIGSVQDELHFEVWQGKEKLNPIHWLKK